MPCRCRVSSFGRVVWEGELPCQVRSQPAGFRSLAEESRDERNLALAGVSICAARLAVIDIAESLAPLIERGVTQQMDGFVKGRLPWRLARYGVWAVLLGGSLAAFPVEAVPALADTPRQLSYDVKHSVFGDIGTYTNMIEASGAVITIKTAAHFLVKAMGIGLHREDAQRVEQWQGDRLVFFHGVTVKNGESTEVSGKAEGNNFVINSPLGTIDAPATVKPANPWSSRSLNSTAMMRVDTGKVEQVKISGGNETNINVDGASTTAREYQITGSTKYKIWIDKRDVPVMFMVDDDSGEVTFTLKK